MRRMILSMMFAAVALSSCEGGYAGQNYRPVIDTRATAARNKISEAEAERALKADLAYCQQLSSERSVLTAGGQSAAVGAVTGAGIGALGGVIYGGAAGSGSLIGAGAGALSALTYGALQGNSSKQDIVNNCLRNSGHVVLAR